MDIRANLGDRRTYIRFHLKGEMWGAVDLSAPVVIRNVSASGALLEAILGPTLQTVPAAELSLPDRPPILVRLRHCAPAPDAFADERLLVGVEFVEITSIDHAAVETFVNTCRAGGAATDR